MGNGWVDDGAMSVDEGGEKLSNQLWHEEDEWHGWLYSFQVLMVGLAGWASKGNKKKKSKGGRTAGTHVQHL